MSAKPKSLIRLFWGTPVPQDLREHLHHYYAQRDHLETLWQHKMSWVNPETWHMTWLFMGDVPMDAVEKLHTKMKKAIDGYGVVCLQMSETAIWPHARSPRFLVWLGEKENTALTQLSQTIRKAFPQYADKKSFKPHVTMARFRKPLAETSPQILLPGVAPSTVVSWQITEICLYQSTLSPQGALHKELYRVSLNASN